jgi:mono/diheme cytochrome c family protein
MRFLRDAVITIVLLGFIAAGIAFVIVRRGGLAADKEPGRIERTVAGQLVRLSIPPDAEQQQNPFAADADAWQDARAHYADHCAVCHGRDGKGNTEVGKNMYPRVPDLTRPEVQKRSDGELFYIIQNGVRWTGMPAWKNEHSAEESWKLVAFLRKAPTLTEADLQADEAVATSGKKPAANQPEPHRHRH